jgi:hypothetical protein
MGIQRTLASGSQFSMEKVQGAYDFYNTLSWKPQYIDGGWIGDSPSTGWSCNMLRFDVPMLLGRVASKRPGLRHL